MRLISFLGTGKYGTTQYTFNAQHCETCYVAAALAHFIKPTEIIILATKEAEKKHGKGLGAEIERLQLAELEFQNIPCGGNTEELWQQFEIISKVITKGAPEAVTLDITHGFRAQPFFAASVIAYLRAIDRKPFDFRVHYGEFRQDELESPIWDLSAFITLLDWSSALHSFIKTGHSKALVALAIDENKRIHKAGGENRPKKLKLLADSLNDFSCPHEHGGFRAQPCPAKSLREQTEKLVAAFEVAQPQPTGKTYFISRHPGAFAWANTQGFQVDECLAHFDVNFIQSGDTVIGTLPVNLIAQVNERGGRYFHLALELPAEMRGQELSAEQMQAFGAQLKEFKAILV